ncbi:MAG: hypothetical protein ACQEQV_08125 [Fibrobacterota bacterium]|jgi:hypothetical protein
MTWHFKEHIRAVPPPRQEVFEQIMLRVEGEKIPQKRRFVIPRWAGSVAAAVLVAVAVWILPGDTARQESVGEVSQSPAEAEVAYIMDYFYGEDVE